MLEADLPGLWSVKSQSLLLTGAHNLLKAQRVSAGAGCSHIALHVVAIVIILICE